jgi:outer membrane murein-binding lipoprotein Lpp
VFWYDRAMNTWVYIGIIVAVAFASSVITYLLTRLRMEKASTERVRALAEAVAALENEKAKFEEAARAIEESAKRKALDEFLADLHVEERRYVRQHRVLFAHRKSLVLQERIFFRNIPISNWVEHEVAVEEGADLDGIAKTLSVFNTLEGETSASRNRRRLMSRAG